MNHRGTCRSSPTLKKSHEHELSKHIHVDETKEESKHQITYYDKTYQPISERLDIVMDDADITASIKHDRQKYQLKYSQQWNGSVIMKLIAEKTKVPIDDMKVIIKGRIMTSDDIVEHLKAKVLIMVIGTAQLPAEGLDDRDITCLINQMSIDRNEAIRVLRKNDGSLLDSILS